MQELQLINGAALAYMGDAVYEQHIRKHVIQKGDTAPNKLHRAAVRYVSATAQAKVMKHWIKDVDILTPEEIDIYKRGRNHKANTKAKNASISDYRQATGFEALIGWLKLTEQEERCYQLMENAIQYIESEVS
ncbi:ribonuclease III [Aerococcaceae bacterium zg-ZJ1578]|uniref:Mini-ribonuclease 3 n=1 Tax=Aerococcaceae TaxID=186827 RepID=UPI0013B91D6B|nr:MULTISPECIES: ribonuclease III domain-containing protein [unclassified Facklamia]MBK0347977.1 ribonuclease III [Aerococcaceae bacterium zg-1578]MBR7927800.1 ribonuclease III [Aerococcaceae bacterium zg-ZUI334]QQD65595.1 ribonuclease III [Aerococcaceae bacterium zg-252]NEW64997.1 ribonuclease III [Facklamia sp. 252]NEW68458.1 ribonuclease III [Facklamia sp. 253]